MLVTMILWYLVAIFLLRLICWRIFPLSGIPLISFLLHLLSISFQFAAIVLRWSCKHSRGLLFQCTPQILNRWQVRTVKWSGHDFNIISFQHVHNLKWFVGWCIVLLENAVTCGIPLIDLRQQIIGQCSNVFGCVDCSCYRNERSSSLIAKAAPYHDSSDKWPVLGGVDRQKTCSPTTPYIMGPRLAQVKSWFIREQNLSKHEKILFFFFLFQIL